MQLFERRDAVEAEMRQQVDLFLPSARCVLV
jgi:hypothetical protein